MILILSPIKIGNFICEKDSNNSIKIYAFTYFSYFFNEALKRLHFKDFSSNENFIIKNSELLLCPQYNINLNHHFLLDILLPVLKTVMGIRLFQENGSISPKDLML